MILKTSKRPGGTSTERSRGGRRKRGLCSVSACGRPHFGRGYCSAHYQQYKRYGPSLLSPIRPNRPNGATLVRDAEGNKLCIACNLWLPPTNFSTHSKTMDKLQVKCRSCYYINRHFLQYKIKREEIAEKLKVQSYSCPICGADIRGRYVVDHNHACCSGTKSCGMCVRGFLCDKCNLGLGAFRDSVETLLKAVKYLEDWKV